MSDKTKYSSFKSQQTITENFRKYVNEVGYYGLGMDGAPPESPEDRNKKLANLAVQSGDKEEIKGYTLALTHIGRYGFNKDGFNKDGFDGMRRKGYPHLSPEWNKGWIQALNDVEEWSKSDKKQSLMNWLIDQQDPYGHYEDEDDREYADFQDDDDYTRSEGKNQQTMTESFRKFLKK